MTSTSHQTDSDTTTQTASDRPVVDSRPLPVRLASFTVERFLPAPQLVLVTLMFTAAVTLAIALRAQIVDAAPAALSNPHWLTLVAGFAASILLIFRLRVFDDVKDAEFDREHEKERPIPRGLVRERELDVLAALILIAEGALFWYVGKIAFYAWAIAAAYTCLMRVEFFVGTWLEKHVLTYAISHMISTAPVFAAIMYVGWEAGVDAPTPSLATLYGTTEILLILTASVLIGIGFELGRKFERYVKAHGQLAYGLLMACPSLGVMCLALVARMEHWWVTVGLLGTVAAATILGHGAVVAKSVDTSDRANIVLEKKHRDAIEMAPGLAGLFAYLVVAAVGLQRMNWWT